MITEDTAPADAAYLATLLAGVTDDQDGIKAAIDAFQQWDAHLTKVFGGEDDRSVDDRALLIAAALLGDAPALRIQSVARDLVGMPAASDNSNNYVRRVLAAEELKARFEGIGATLKGQNASLTGKPGLGNATIERVWTQRPDLRQPLLEWITRITAPKAEAEEHLQHIGRMLVRLAAAHTDVRLLRLVQKWVEAEGSATDRRPLVATILNEAAQDPTLGPVVRDELLNWAQSSSLNLATTVALVCQMTFAEHYPRQALVRLQWILRRPQDDEAVTAAEEAVRRMAARPSPLVKDVWPAVTRWAVKDGMLSGRRAFLAMVDPRPSYSHLKELLAVADDKPEVRGMLLDAWRATLADEMVDGEARAVLTAWAYGIATGTLPESTTLELLHQIVQHHLTASPVSALLYDTNVLEPEPHPGGLAHVRRLLWQRVHTTGPSPTRAEC
ncbi:hypothetical protein C1J01_11050 [Nonomuraea aridisoli]|uniref:Uncharacterized protein n=1 Tax=Nonomuraea aridisoli TaxID=2070368 RepID=A0A2W2E712_9ACTN|nr:hypothetical protein C1J01_11050 [Nonomuraea aridisoli]